MTATVDRSLVEKFGMASLYLATLPGRIQERRVAALTSWSAATAVTSFPDAALQDAWDRIRDRMTSVTPSGNEGQYQAAASAMTEDQASEVAKAVFVLERQLRELWTIEHHQT